MKPGNCIAFGSAFKVPTLLCIDMPNPRPLSNNVDLATIWYNKNNKALQSNSFGNSDDVNVIMARQMSESSGNKFLNYGDEPIQEVTTPTGNNTLPVPPNSNVQQAQINQNTLPQTPSLQQVVTQNT